MGKISKFLKALFEDIQDFGELLIKIVIILIIFLFALTTESATEYKFNRCKKEAEAMDLESDFIDGRCVYILPDGTRVLSDKYFVVNIPYTVDME